MIILVLGIILLLVICSTLHKDEHKHSENIYTGVEIMEKLEALLFKDEEGTHYVPLANISSICEEIGKYSYTKREYREKYPKTRYVVRMQNTEAFYITKQVYEKIIEYCYNVVVEGKRSNGDF